MGAVYVQEGRAIDYIPTADAVAGTVMVLGELAGVLQRDCKAGELGALAVSDVFDFPKAVGAGSGLGAGVPAFWDAAAKQATANAAGGANKPLGLTIRVAADGDETVRVLLGR
jgi:predicted RecA/RadA family phage recombinase